jgi:hypothetical protein
MRAPLWWACPSAQFRRGPAEGDKAGMDVGILRREAATRWECQAAVACPGFIRRRG